MQPTRLAGGTPSQGRRLLIWQAAHYLRECNLLIWQAAHHLRECNFLILQAACLLGEPSPLVASPPMTSYCGWRAHIREALCSHHRWLALGTRSSSAVCCCTTPSSNLTTRARACSLWTRSLPRTPHTPQLQALGSPEILRAAQVEHGQSLCTLGACPQLLTVCARRSTGRSNG